MPNNLLVCIVGASSILEPTHPNPPKAHRKKTREAAENPPRTPGPTETAALFAGGRGRGGGGGGHAQLARGGGGEADAGAVRR